MFVVKLAALPLSRPVRPRPEEESGTQCKSEGVADWTMRRRADGWQPKESNNEREPLYTTRACPHRMTHPQHPPPSSSSRLLDPVLKSFPCPPSSPSPPPPPPWCAPPPDGGFARTSMAARVAASNVSSTPSLRSAEHSWYERAPMDCAIAWPCVTGPTFVRVSQSVTLPLQERKRLERR